MDQIIDTLRRQYKPDELWLDQAKRICRKRLWGYPDFEWTQVMDAMLREMLSVERSRGYLLVGESSFDFFARLSFALMENEHSSLAEHDGFVGALTQTRMQKDLSKEMPHFSFASTIARVVLLKACLEIARKRKRSNTSLSVDKLLAAGYDKPLESRSIPSFEEAMVSGGLEQYERITSSSEFHLAAADYYGLFEYRNAIEKMSLRFTSLEAAYESLSTIETPSECESIFLKSYVMNKKSCSVDWKQWL